MAIALTPTVSQGSRRALLYDRVSTLMQARSGYSGGADGFQIDRCRTHAAARSYVCVGELTDVDSGAEWNIVGIMQALDRAKRSEYDVLVVSDTSRFARNLAKKTVYEAELRRYGITVEYLNLPLDDGPEGRFISNVFGALDELERERIAWRTQQGLHQKAQKGLVVGSGPVAFGHQYVTRWDDTKRKDIPIGMAPHPERAEIVRRLYRDIAFYSAIDLARQLTAEGVQTRTGRSVRWCHTTVRQILRNPVHKGEWYFDGIMVPVPPIVD
jgi:DNA invertase Pin-like site-specific DNA recombinase